MGFMSQLVLEPRLLNSWSKVKARVVVETSLARLAFVLTCDHAARQTGASQEQPYEKFKPTNKTGQSSLSHVPRARIHRTRRRSATGWRLSEPKHRRG